MKDVRLPTSLRPLHYLVRLHPYVRGNFSIMGYVEVEVEVVTETSTFTLHIADIITRNKTVKVGVWIPRNGMGKVLALNTSLSMSFNNNR